MKVVLAIASVLLATGLLVINQPVQAQNCAPGSYYCPGEVPGCCPNGWGCGSTSCIRPGQQPAPRPQAKTCPAGQYWCPGTVAGCCPNGWGCGDTTCIRRR